MFFALADMMLGMFEWLCMWRGLTSIIRDFAGISSFLKPIVDMDAMELENRCYTGYAQFYEEFVPPLIAYMKQDLMTRFQQEQTLENLADFMARYYGASMANICWLRKIKGEREQRISELEASVLELEERLGMRDAAIRSMLGSLQTTQEHVQKFQKENKKLRRQIATLEARPTPEKAPDCLTLEALRIALGHGRCHKMDEMSQKLTAAKAKIKELELRLVRSGLASRTASL
jgi:hypothetical protein